MNTDIKKHYLLLFVFFFITYAYFFQGGGWNQNSRICLTRAIIHEWTFQIDRYKEDCHDPYFHEFVNTGDWAYFEGHYYTNKSPGLSFMAVVPFGVVEYFLKYIFPSNPQKQVFISAYISTLCTTVLLASLLCLLLFHVFTRFFGLGIAAGLMLTFFYGLGTLVFSYSTTFYCHLPSAFFSFLSFVLAMGLKHGRVQRKKTVALFSGFSVATAVLVEPSTVFTLWCIVGYFVCFKEGRRHLPFFFLGCVPPAIVQGFYNVVCFGGPFNTSYTYSNNQVMWIKNGSLFGLQSPKVLLHLLILPYRGIFVSSPVLLMIFPGMIFLLKQRKWIAETVISGAVFILFLILIACTFAWHGGSGAGPRYLLPAYPFLFLLTAFAIKEYPKFFKVIGFLSVIINFSITLIGNEIPWEIRNPLGDVVFKEILTGRVSINPSPISHFGMDNIYRVSEIAVWPQNFNSFNWGEFIFPHHIASVLPLFCFWALWWLLWRRDSSGKE